MTCSNKLACVCMCACVYLIYTSAHTHTHVFMLLRFDVASGEPTHDKERVELDGKVPVCLCVCVRIIGMKSLRNPALIKK